MCISGYGKENIFRSIFVFFLQGLSYLITQIMNLRIEAFMNKQSISSLSSVLHSRALGIAGGYLLLGSLWILFSDQLAARVALNEEMLTSISLYKGWGYVLVTALLLYWLIRRYIAAL